MEIILSSNNFHKLVEFKKVFEKYDIKILSLKDVGINIEVEETGKTFKENAFLKAEAISKMTDKIVVADDSGLEVHALDGFPGIYYSRFMEGKPYEEKFAAINEKLKDKENRQANFNCTLCVINLEKEPLYFEGKAFGEIIESPRGESGFGYDPIFLYTPSNKTFAELTNEEKNQVSHRGNAIKLLLQYLKENNYIHE